MSDVVSDGVSDVVSYLSFTIYFLDELCSTFRLGKRLTMSSSWRLCPGLYCGVAPADVTPQTACGVSIEPSHKSGS